MAKALVARTRRPPQETARVELLTECHLPGAHGAYPAGAIVTVHPTLADHMKAANQACEPGQAPKPTPADPALDAERASPDNKPEAASSDPA